MWRKVSIYKGWRFIEYRRTDNQKNGRAHPDIEAVSLIRQEESVTHHKTQRAL